jgi:hypothetical protein
MADFSWDPGFRITSPKKFYLGAPHENTIFKAIYIGS